MKNPKQDLLQIVAIYILIGLSGFLSWMYIPMESEILRFFIAHLVMTVVCFIFSLIKKNTSVYDAFWSVIPFYFALMWLYIHAETLNIFNILTLVVVSLWSWRLTLNWTRSWDGFSHEDWRYIDMAKKTGKMYPIVNFLGLHLFPTLMVFAGSLPLFFIFGVEEPNLLLYVLGIIISLIGVAFEYFADNELYKFRNRSNAKQEDVLQTGLWGRSRYPNYLGEVLFWIGLAVVGQAYAAPWYTLIGCIAMFLMIRFVSIPMKEERMSKRRIAFKKYQETTPLLLPRIGKKSS